MENLSLHTRNLYKQIRKDIRNSSTIYILSSFVMKSGIEDGLTIFRFPSFLYGKGISKEKGFF